ncbi:GAP family protein [Actinoalloteichus hymeniacidonis]|uniref:DUF2910 family protein n=1 Tax=Actinoalloteichus hymeniacidonis TaxID=340345 RepID=A0AAC9HRJ4_9PSEU|nr:GAP family protein [Actinoalloteichus hymeniacidonis]AOS64252.1 putative DUF2910 family protein [Actinoalloteichus hymeniacidonis]MBB5907680.1 cytochrome c biogenesis protein CcdA [Actinoalloteichus hymeniacidonis]
MTIALALGLIGLALVDSTSIGTLFIPIWLLLAPGRVRLGRFAVYLGTIVVFYFAVGLLILLGAEAFLDSIGSLLSSIDETVLRSIQLALGVGLFAYSFRLTSKRQAAKSRPGRMTQWRERAMIGEGNTGSLISLALLAATIEVATMLPYLAAIGLLIASGMSFAATTLTLALYCMVMVLPALVLILARLIAHQRVDPLLQRLNDWMTKNGGDALGWIVGIAGFLLARDAVVFLFFAD